MIEQTTRPRVGRPPLTDRHALLAAAREIGFEDLTVGRVTEAVGVKYSTFYRHFAGVDALAAALADDVCDEVELAEPSGTWQTYLVDTCAALFDLLDRHPGLAEVVVRLPALPRRILEAYRRLTDVLLAAGFPPDRAALGAVCALEVVATTRLTHPDPEQTLAGRRLQVRTTDEPIDEDVRAETARLADDSVRTRGARKIALLVRGLEADLDAVPTAQA